MEEEDTSSRYSDTDNDIRNPNHAADVGIFELPNSDVNWSNAVQGQGGGTSQSNICINIITATKGESDVRISSFNNLVVDCSNGGQGQGSREFEGICHKIESNEITADNGSTKVGFENFGNVNYKTTSNKDHGKAAGGSSSAQCERGGGGKKPKGGGLNIRGNHIKGDRGRKAYRDFSNFERNLKTTNTEDGGSTSQANIHKNKITAHNGASYVGMFNFHNCDINAGQAQGGCEGNEGFLKHKGVSHKICKNTIIAVNSGKVGIQNFGNIKYNSESIYKWIIAFFGLSY
ncbi:unnamed protein product [Prunus armeniaca]|uniref:Uncharacterized protein n=1 Tax=Prunus armeniaca TaxID=36596 RepID=A0A6J5W291_PRUAR|nr:unnamed protein product [Prunus armeniaca]CAB4294122.1 unnamed protein product [Prunus armeniaca]